MSRFVRRISLGIVLVALPIALAFVSYKVAEASIASTTVLTPLSPDNIKEQPPPTPAASAATPPKRNSSSTPNVTEDPASPSGGGSGGGTAVSLTALPSGGQDSGGSGEPGHTGGDD